MMESSLRRKSHGFDARACPLVDTDHEPVGWIVEHRNGAARLSVTGEWT